jgi:hypothetical protein
MQYFPDPALTANLYCAGGLDEVLFRVVAPFWRELRLQDPERLCYLWVVRYGRGGEHLKIRVHGPEDLLSRQRELLEARAAAFFSSLPEPAALPPNEVNRESPPIDEEDKAGGGHPDRTLLWTTYVRSHVSLGGKPFLSGDRYAALLTRCLAAGCDLILAQEPGPGGALPHGVRQRTLLKALVAGLGALRLPAEAWNDYLAYHRDWLLRFVLPKERRAELQSLEQIRQRIDEQVAARRDSFVPLWRAAVREWDKGEAEEADERPEPGWRESLAALWEHVRPFCADPEYRLDPFASDPAFAPVFKAFHGFANQIGLRLADEAFTHHLLLRAIQGEGAGQERAAS